MLIFFVFFQELVASDPNQKNWKGISIAIFVISIILLSVFISVRIMTPKNLEEGDKGIKFAIEHILDPKFIPRPFNGSWISGDESI